MYDFETYKTKMLENQLLASGLISFKTALKLAEIPREHFLPETMKSKSYLDEDIIVDDDYFLISPLSLAKLIDISDIKKTDLVLDLTCGYGYSTAVLSAFSNMVVGINNNKTYEETATKNFANLAIDNAVSISADTGLEKNAPYDIIMIAGIIERIPEHLLNLLSNEGKLITVCMINNKTYNNNYYGTITKIIKKGRVFDTQKYSNILLPKVSLN